MDKLYTVKDLTEMLKLTRRTIYRYIQSGELKTVKVGKEHRIKESDLESFLNR